MYHDIVQAYNQLVLKLWHAGCIQVFIYVQLRVEGKSINRYTVKIIISTSQCLLVRKSYSEVIKLVVHNI